MEKSKFTFHVDHMDHEPTSNKLEKQGKGTVHVHLPPSNSSPKQREAMVKNLTTPLPKPVNPSSGQTGQPTLPKKKTKQLKPDTHPAQAKDVTSPQKSKPIINPRATKEAALNTFLKQNISDIAQHGSGSADKASIGQFLPASHSTHVLNPNFSRAIRNRKEHVNKQLNKDTRNLLESVLKFERATDSKDAKYKYTVKNLQKKTILRESIRDLTPEETRALHKDLQNLQGKTGQRVYKSFSEFYSVIIQDDYPILRKFLIESAIEFEGKPSSDWRDSLEY